MAGNSFNAVRTYTVPPRWMLDAASTHGLRVMVGLPWEQHVAFLDDRARGRAIEARVRARIRECAGHPAVLAYAVGNEIPAPVVRWHGARRIERFLSRLAAVAREEDGSALLTYVNYPTTEYVDTSFADFLCFNVYLEEPDRLDAYLARLHNLAGDRPLVLAEVGLDSRRHGEIAQARLVEREVRGAFASGCAGVFVFSWTDEWHRGGDDVLDWDFGLTDRARRPKPALHTVRRAMEDAPIAAGRPWPRVSVVVCSYNGARTIGECLDSLLNIRYPNFEVIVVDDGSTDATPEIAASYGVRLVSTPNRGLSSARNLGCSMASGEIVAYIDDDAHADPHWLLFLAAAFRDTDHAGLGGPNIPPADDGEIAHAVAASPGGPAHVLVSDTEAEHIPGCNMAFRKSALDAIGGFDPRFRTAGDDVDVCWRLRERGLTLGFVPAAVVWHHRRNSVRAYWKQQVGYGRAEALLEEKSPERYNAVGHASWAGRIYGGALDALRWRRPRVYHGTWGCAPFQSVYAPAPGLLPSIVAMPEWLLVVAALLAVSALGIAWAPLLTALPLAALAAVGPVALAAHAAARVRPPSTAMTTRARARFRALVFALHLLQPVARLRGRLGHGLTPWRRSVRARLGVPRPFRLALWTEGRWQAPESRLLAVEDSLRTAGAVVRRGGDFDDWDLDVRGGLLGGARVRLLVEEHGGGKQLARLRAWPRSASLGAFVVLILGGLAAAAAASGTWPVALALGVPTVAIVARAALDAAAALAAVRDAWAALATATPGGVTVDAARDQG